ncbi:2-keto-4-pentenoate hydratase/2-oxohepta-3-ene-1,7-dioic acid hydratase [Gottschalkia purinilytica]|uniref:2-keto-4-pentenoate hydratase/2-oxohepta-3-ene-1,7-dioic acid hydratase n=1 Tax=Gottschalkia purinilytica TaxID=1503 RepID=A0A0L0WF35_GOTPU|nr:fumarylacetoacetate hydrolase family protein [Gottschalkia purinilytica]KNF10030.1 2-keto-4-pentenoate hydratase/2-oxohepta-3-ene-1,7-dioic acid hydratase [Gottschalkia purinilytica]
MYFLTFRFNNEEKIGILNSSKTGVIIIDEVFKKLNKTIPDSLHSLILDSSDNTLINDIKKCIELHRFDSISLDNIKLCPPISYPNRVFGVGKNYVKHIKEIGVLGGNIGEQPIFFSKIADPAIGDGDFINIHSSVTEKVDYEAELAVVIGKDGSNIKREEVENYIFGYTIANDISSRDLQAKHVQWFKGKNLDTFCSIGPYIVYKDLIPIPVELNISSKVNGELRQNSNTKNMLFDISHIISTLSQGFTLKAGDIIMTGTPEGTGVGFDPPKFLKSGDKIECTIEKIGTLTNFAK